MCYYTVKSHPNRCLEPATRTCTQRSPPPFSAPTQPNFRSPTSFTMPINCLDHTETNSCGSHSSTECCATYAGIAGILVHPTMCLALGTNSTTTSASILGHCFGILVPSRGIVPSWIGNLLPLRLLPSPHVVLAMYCVNATCTERAQPCHCVRGAFARAATREWRPLRRRRWPG